MTNRRAWAGAALLSGLLAACGGASDGDQNPKVKFTKMVSFGDSLSDVGSYATPALVASTGGGKYTVNGPSVKIWIEQLSATLGLGAVCAAQIGLQSSGPLAALAAPTTNVANCYGYGQGGARVTNPIGVANKALAPGDSGGYLGQLTDPVINQLTRHLTASGGSYSGTELVLVLAGANDLFINLGAIAAGLVTPTAGVTAMGLAGAELAGYVKALVLAKGAKYVVVVNLPDVSKTPFAYGTPAATQGLIQTMASTFNAQLKAGLAGTSVVQVDAYTQSQNQAANPAQYGVTNATATACDLTKATLGSLGCSAATLVAGDVSHYQFADTVHPTPYGYQLLAQYVATQMAIAGWL